MSYQKTVSRSAKVANAFGALGYMSIIVQWAWSILIIAYPFLTSDELASWISQKTASTPEPTELGMFTPAVTVIAIAVTLFVMTTTIILVARLPKKIGRQGARVTHATAHKLVPTITRHQPLSKKQRRIISYQLTLTIKLALVITPLLMLGFAAPISTLTLDIIWAVGLFCASCSIIYFIIQQLIARIRGIKRDAIW